MKEIEDNIKSVWQGIFKYNDITLDCNFFALGGNSIKAMLIIANLSNKFDINIDIHDIFENPTILQLSKIVASIVTSDSGGIKPLSQADDYAVSHAQTRLWLISQNEEHSVAYNVHSAFLLEGNLCLNSFEKSFEQLIQRHESLRTTFDFIKVELRQIIHEQIDLPLEIIDLSDVAHNKQKAKELYKKEALTPFDLKDGLLFKVKLVNLGSKSGKQSYLFIFNAHHIICDGWSNNILFKELGELYKTYKNNQPVNLEPLKIQYKEFAVWQNNFIKSDEIVQHREYWLNKLSGELLPPLSIDFVKKNKDFEGKLHCFKIDKELKSRISSLCVNHNITLYTLMTSVIKVLLSHYSSQENIIISSPVAERSQPELVSQIGYYLNTIILNDSVQDKENFAQLVEKVKKTISDGLKHQVYPIDILINDLCTENQFIQSIFSVMVNVIEDYNSSLIELDGIHAAQFIETSLTSRTDLNITVKSAKEMEVIIEYKNVLFSEQEIHQIKHKILLLLDEITRDFNANISCLKKTLISKEVNENNQK